MPEQPILRVKLLRPGLTAAPHYASEGAAGLDLSAAIEAPLEIPPGGHVAVPTGISIALPAGYEGQVRPRSGLAARHGVAILNAPGTIDADYRGEVSVLLVNLGREIYTINPGDRIAQLVVAPVVRVTVEIAPQGGELNRTTRGAGGFGSTGK